MLTFMVVRLRKPGMSEAEFHHVLAVHGPMALKIPGLEIPAEPCSRES
jgi:hypothetical protein